MTANSPAVGNTVRRVSGVSEGQSQDGHTISTNLSFSGAACPSGQAAKGGGVMEKLRVLDLFSGIGGFSLGLERTGGFETVAFCEIERRLWPNLSKHFPGVPIFADIKDLSGDPFAVDVICGGFPCQPYSTASAGRANGKDDDRALWPEMRRLISEIMPEFVIGENVAGIDRLDLERVVSDLEALGFSVWPLEIPACAVGFDHRRPRIWFIGHANENSKPKRTINEKAPGLHYRGPRLEGVGGSHGLSFWMGAIGNAVVPQIPELIGRAILAARAA